MRKPVRISLLSVVILAFYALANSGIDQLMGQKSRQQTTGCNADSDTAVVRAPLMAASIDVEKILKREGYTVSYNVRERQPNYVAWVLSPARVKGSARRCSTFFHDPELSDDERSTLDDYRSSGYDRGHMCPAGDNKWSSTAMIESFYLSNVCPQKHTLNGGSWRVLEEACRKWVGQRNENIYIVSGTVFKKDERKLIHRRVRVPAYFFKTLLCLDKGHEKGIGFIFCNDTSDQPVEQHVCSIDSIEKLTGYDLYASLSQSLQQKLESQSCLRIWQGEK